MSPRALHRLSTAAAILAVVLGAYGVAALDARAYLAAYVLAVVWAVTGILAAGLTRRGRRPSGGRP